MNIEIDTENRTITLKEDVPLKDIVELSKALKKWREYDIIAYPCDWHIKWDNDANTFTTRDGIYTVEQQTTPSN